MAILLLVALAYADPEADPEADAEGSADYQLETDAWVGNDGGYYGYYPSFGVYRYSAEDEQPDYSKRNAEMRMLLPWGGMFYPLF